MIEDATPTERDWTWTLLAGSCVLFIAIVAGLSLADLLGWFS